MSTGFVLVTFVWELLVGVLSLINAKWTGRKAVWLHALQAEILVLGTRLHQTKQLLHIIVF